MNLHINLRIEREKREWTQKSISKKLGVAASTYSNWEQGNREPDLEVLIKLADIYQIPLDQLVGRNFTSPLKISVDLDLLQFFAEVQAAREDQRKEIVRYWKFMNERS
ncbi:helix-turn-helix domain-containing protein [Paenibacillus tyrfis]|uniref:helix-turn-helix domain-containing protein n=1 Tax=Paenibacillus tyrfis TaxID=1501230 RepID=UPI0015C5E897|nr:helix-turn-helix transcriptional regulator [Paenibacillus tyrfis]